MANENTKPKTKPEVEVEESGQPLLNAWRDAIRNLKTVSDEQAQHDRRTKELAERLSVSMSEVAQAERAFKDWLNSR